MSRKSRSRGFVPRWGHTNLAAPKVQANPTAEDLAYLNRAIKRANKAAGHATAKQPSSWKWDIGTENGGVVEAHTKSEARALIKSSIGLTKKERLPVEILIFKVVRSDNE